jgi:hypothetical protein
MEQWHSALCLKFNAGLAENKSLIGCASITTSKCSVLNNLKHKFQVNKTGNVRVNVTSRRVRVTKDAVEMQ